jgi:hypothetical protein
MTHPHTNDRAPKHWIAAPALLLLALMTLAGTARADSLWLHVKVDGDHADERVTVNLPLSLIEKAIPMIPENVMEHGRIQFDEGEEITIADLREMWNEIQSQPDFTIARVESEDENVRVAKEGDYLIVRVDEGEGGSENVNVRIPVAVVDALFSGDGEQLNIRAALEALAAHGEGELVTVTDHDEVVRVWVDGFSEAR